MGIKTGFIFFCSVVAWAGTARASAPPDSEHFICKFDPLPGEEPAQATVDLYHYLTKAKIQFEGDVFSGTVEKREDGYHIDIKEVLEITSVFRFANEGEMIIRWSAEGGDAPRPSQFSAHRLYDHLDRKRDFTLLGACTPSVKP